MRQRYYLLLVMVILFVSVLYIEGIGAWDVNVIEFIPDDGIVKFNDEVVDTASKPIIVNDRLYVPIRTVSNLIGATIQWNATERIATMYVPDFVSMLSEIKQKENIINELKNRLSSSDLYGNVLQLIVDDYLYKNSLSISSLTYSAIKGMISSLRDPYTRFFTPAEVKLRKALLSPSSYSVGIELTRSSGKYIVLSVVDGSPAYYAGVLPGDVVEAINGIYVRKRAYDDVKMLMSATSPKKVTLNIIRGGTPLVINVTTALISQTDFYYDLIKVDDKNIAYIRIKTMKDDVVSKMDIALKELFFKLHGEADAYIIDLRGNFGGNIDVARRLLGFFLGGKEVYTLVDGNDNTTVMYAPVSRWMISEERPVYVLVDEGTTSAAEVFAMAMKSYRRAILVGQTTYGKGVASVVYKFGDGSMLSLTAYEVLGPHGEKLNGAGVLPDVWSMTLYARQQAISLFKRGILYPGDLGGR